MSQQTMSIHQMIQQAPLPKTPDQTTCPTNTFTGKVKIFYSVKGQDTNCLCSFDTTIDSKAQDDNWINVPLKRCLISVCSSCPDQLMHSSHDTAIYSANFEDVLPTQEVDLKDHRSLVWEGHGLLSNILSSPSDTQVTGKLKKSNIAPYTHTIQVIIQLHPVHHRPHYDKNINRPDSTPNAQTPLPSMKLLLSEPDPYVGHSDHYEDQIDNFHGSHKLGTPNTHSFMSPIQDYSTGNYSNQADPLANRLSQSFISPIKHPRPEDSPTSVSSSSSSMAWRPLSDPTDTDQLQSKKRKQISPAKETIPHSSDTAELQRLICPSTQTAKPNTHGKSYPSGNIKTLVDAYYHQSRRKKRDTKPPNVNDVRSYVEIDKNTLGMYILPAEVDSWTVLDLGKVVWDRASFHNQRYIYPVGYRVKKWYRSMVDPHSDTQYTCQILDGGDEPIFQLDADDNPGEVWRGPTPTTVWTIAVRRAFAIRNMDYGHNPVGPDFFGLRKNTIAKMIQDLPNADKCQNYIWQHFEATSGSRGKAMRRTSARVGSASSISSALSEPVSHVTSPPRFSHNSPSSSKAEPHSPSSETSLPEKSS
ncbi:hypothetical protein CLU79DRAFT_743225 [Phycomyces nitens]|nr:hypothetical protein CLU79DRAFT_743225 [Phycomyces nitens]